MPELVPVFAEIHTDMTDAAETLIFSGMLTKEQARFVGRSGLDLIFHFLCGVFDSMHLAELFECGHIAHEAEFILNMEATGAGELQLLRHQRGTRVVYHHRLFLDDIQLSGIII